jgi:hypothetical protein
MKIRPLIVLALALASVLFLWACGGDGGGDEDPQEVLQASQETEESINSGNLSLTIDVSAGGEQEGSFELNAEGPFQGEEGGFPKFDIAGDFSAEGGGQSFSADGAVISTGTGAFLEYQDTAYELPQQAFDQFAGIVTAAQEQQEAGGEECRTALEGQGLGTADLFSDLSNEGTEDIEGAETIHITGGLDFAKVSEFIKAGADTPACSQSLGQQFDQAQIDQVEQQLTQADDFLQDFELGLYIGKDDDLVHGFDASFGVDAQGQEVDFDFEARIGAVNEPQTVAAPENVQPIDALLQNLGVDPAILNQALGQLGAAGSGGLPQAGGSPAAPSSGATDAYLQCIQEAQGAAALQQCEALLP